MTDSALSHRYEVFRELLIEHRKACQFTQLELAEALKKPQSYISKYESGERRLDLIEFIEIAEVLDIDKLTFLNEIVRRAAQ
jgi:transcriptional regulator with XRE-family HTH domain